MLLNGDLSDDFSFSTILDGFEEGDVLVADMDDVLEGRSRRIEGLEHHVGCWDAWDLCDVVGICQLSQASWFQVNRWTCRLLVRGCAIGLIYVYAKVRSKQEMLEGDAMSTHRVQSDTQAVYGRLDSVHEDLQERLDCISESRTWIVNGMDRRAVFCQGGVCLI